MKQLTSLLTVFAGLVLLCACGKRETPVERANREQMLLLGNGAEPKDLDPHVVTGLPEHYIISSLIEGLVIEDPKTVEILPGMAESWDISEDGTTYTFHLRDAEWSNGDPVVAGDFVYGVKRILNPELGGENAYMLYILKNAEAFNKGELTDFSEVGVKAVDDKTLQYTLRGPSPYFLPRLIHYAWFPVNPTAVDAVDGFAKIGSGWTKPGRFVGNGPFTLSEWRVNDRIVVTKNPTYYGAEQVKLNGITFFPIDDENTEERAFRTGQLHVTGTVPYNKIVEYKAKPDSELRVHDYVSTYYYMFNTTREPFNDPRVRRALTYAIDRDAIVKHITGAGEQVALHFVPPKMPDYAYSAKVEPSLAEAKRLIEEVASEKYPDGFPPVQLLYNKSELHLQIAESIQQMWKKNLGIEVELVNQEWKVYLDTRNNLQYDVCRAGWVADYADPNTFLDMFITDSGNNNTGWSNQEYDDLIKRAGATASAEERMELLQQAETILLTDLPIAPIYFYVSKSLVRPEVKGWYPNILDHHPYTAISLEP